MVKRQNPKRVTLPNGRTFYAKYKKERNYLQMSIFNVLINKELLRKEGEGGEQLLDNVEEVSKALSKTFLKKVSTLPKR